MTAAYVPAGHNGNPPTLLSEMHPGWAHDVGPQCWCLAEGVEPDLPETAR